MRGLSASPAKCLALSVLLCAVAGAAPGGEAPPSSRAGGIWTGQTSGVSTALTGLAFVDSLEGFAVGGNGVVLRTLDGGAAWAPQTAPVGIALNAVALGTANAGAAVADGADILNTVNGATGTPSTWALATTGDLLAVTAVDDSTAWVVGQKGAFRRTTDGGSKWKKLSANNTDDIRSVAFQNATEGYAVGASGRIRVTIDGGDTWTIPGAGTIGVLNTVNGISMVPGTTTPNAIGWAVGTGAIIRKTITSGTAWTTPTVNAAAGDLNAVFAGDVNTAWASGVNGQILTTTNGGTNWDAQTSNAGSSNLLGISFVNSGGWNGIAVGSGGTVVWTADGLAWTAGTSGTTESLRAVHVFNTGLAIAVGDNGKILKSVDGGATWATKGVGTTIEHLTGVRMGDASFGWATGLNGTVLKTSDGGETWVVQVSHVVNTVNLKDIKFGSVIGALAVGSGGTILRTTNGGVHFNRRMNGAANWTTSDLNGVAYSSVLRAWAVGAAGTMIRTDDGGTTWTPLAAVTPDPLYSITALSDSLFIAVGGAGHGTIVTISLSGAVWTATPATVGTVPWRAVAFPTFARRGYAVDDAGQVWLTTSAGNAWETEDAALGTSLRALAFPCQTLGWTAGDGGVIRRRDGAPPTLSFPPHIGTPYTYQPPLIDGFINPELSETRRPDTGWDRAAEVTFANGTVQPPVTFTGLRNNGGNYLYLGFDVRGDDMYDPEDSIVLLFRPNATTPRAEHSSLDRRLIIYPLKSGTGIGTSEGSPDGGPVAPGYAAPSYTYNHENGAPQLVKSYSWTAGWHVIPDSTEVQVKVRSWVPTAGNLCWSVEVRVPITNATYTDWINIGTDFLFSFYVLQKKSGGVLEASWPRDLVLSGPADIEAAPMPACDWGLAKLGSASDGVGVRIKVPYYTNIGANTSGGSGTLEHRIHGMGTNTFVANVQNDSNTPADNVSAVFRIADWGVNGGDATNGAWHKVPVTSGSNPPAAATIPAQSLGVPGVTQFKFDWTLNAAEKLAYAAPNDHQCMQVSLSSASNVNFVERSSWINMEYVPTSKYQQAAFVSAKGYGYHGARDGIQRFYLHVLSERHDHEPSKDPTEIVKKPDPNTDGQSENRKQEHPYYSGENLRRVRLQERFPQLRSEKTSAGYLTWVVNAERETTNTVRIRGHDYPILEPVNGFGYVARHGDAVGEWAASFTGASVKKLSEHVYEVDVPVNGRVQLETTVESFETLGLGHGTTPTGGLLGLILLILLFLIVIFWFLKKKP